MSEDFFSYKISLPEGEVLINAQPSSDPEYIDFDYYLANNGKGFEFDGGQYERYDIFKDSDVGDFEYDGLVLFVIDVIRGKYKNG